MRSSLKAAQGENRPLQRRGLGELELFLNQSEAHKEQTGPDPSHVTCLSQARASGQTKEPMRGLGEGTSPLLEGKNSAVPVPLSLTLLS